MDSLTTTSMNIELYNLLRLDLRLSDGRSRDFIRILDADYKNGVRADLATLTRQMNEGFQRMDSRFTVQDKRMDELESKIDAVRSDMQTTIGDVRSDMRMAIGDVRSDMQMTIGDVRSDLRIEMRDLKFDLVKWMIGFFVGLALLILGSYLKK